MRIEVATPGPLSLLVAPVPADRHRVEALPGDTIALQLLVASSQQVWATDALDPAWLVCEGPDCLFGFSAAHLQTPCDGPLAFLDGCTIGRGADARLRIPVPDLTRSFAAPTVFAVAGVPGEATTEACLQAITHRPPPSLRGCAIIARSVRYGPAWVLQALLGSTDPERPTPPEELLQQPNFNPEVERFSVRVGSAGATPIDARAGDTIAVDPGDDVWVEFESDPRDAQRFVVGVDATGHLTRTVEYVGSQWYASTAVEGITTAFDPTQHFVVPDDVDAVRLDLVVDDSNGGVGWGSLTFEVDDGAP
ncbi:MAG: hypothetical protein K1X88_27070 [Nannocystaceae bacterium]|nr:hypothetical protein [Nannocystaceae bacterium]